MSFRRGGKKIKVQTTQSKDMASPLLLVCAESLNMLEGLTEEEAEQYFTDYDNIIPLYEVNVAELVGPYQTEFSQSGSSWS